MKISTIPQLCPDAGMRPRTVVTAFLVGAALADSVVEDDMSFMRSAVLGLMHVGIFVWGRTSHWPCCCRV